MGAISTPSMGLRVTAVWRPHPVWHALTSVSSAGGQWVIVDYVDEKMNLSLTPSPLSIYLPPPPSLSLSLPPSSFRHHTNPVGTEWRWKMDDPEMILKGALENHYQMIKQFRGMCAIHLHSYVVRVVIHVGNPISCPLLVNMTLYMMM